jgi:SAM-dependent methyltransferase
LAGYYDESYYEDGYRRYEALRRESIGRSLKHISGWFPPGCRVLDFGAGIGFWAEALRAAGHFVYTFDASEAARRALARRNFPVASSLGEIPTGFDVAITMDVLGHCDKPAHILDALAGRLKPGGTLIIRAPSFQASWRAWEREIARCKNAEPFGYPTLLWRFKPRDVRRMFAAREVTPVKTIFESQPWSTLQSRQSRALRRVCCIWDRLTGQGDEFYVIGRTRS